MAGRSDAGRPETDLARIDLGVGYGLRDCLGCTRRIDHHHEGEVDDARNGGDVAEKTEFEFVVEGRVDRVRRTSDEERIAVRGRPHDRLDSDIVAATRAVFDDELLAQPPREPWSDEPRDNVGRTAGTRGGNDPYWPRRITLRPRDPRHGRGRARAQMQKLSAGTASLPDNTGNEALYSALMFAALMIGHHFSISAFCCAASASGVCLSRGQSP